MFSVISVEWVVTKLPFIPDWVYDRFLLLVSDTEHPNVMAGSLVILLLPTVAWLLFDWRGLGWLTRGLLSFVSFMVSGTLLITQSRGSLIAFSVVMVVLVILRWGWIALVVTTLLHAISTSGTKGGIEGRLETWSRAIYMIQDFPLQG